MANGLMAGLIKPSAGHNTKKLMVLSPVNRPRRDPKRTFLKGIILDFTLKKKKTRHNIQRKLLFEFLLFTNIGLARCP